MKSDLLFQYCQKLVIFSPDMDSVLLARRKGEADYDGTFSFIGGKMETGDASLLEGMKREKDEEIGPQACVSILPNESYNLLFRKKDGSSMVLPHIAGLFVSGDIVPGEEYSEYRWVPLDRLEAFGPKIPNIPELARWAHAKLQIARPDELAEI